MSSTALRSRTRRRVDGRKGAAYGSRPYITDGSQASPKALARARAGSAKWRSANVRVIRWVEAVEARRLQRLPHWLECLAS